MTFEHWCKTQTDAALDGLIIPQRIFTSGGTGAQEPGDSPSRPFAVIRQDLDAPGVLPSFPTHQKRWSVWVHDEPGTMKKINAAVKALKFGIPILDPVQGTGVLIVQCSWQATGPDAFDDHYKTNTRYVDFLATYREND